MIVVGVAAKPMLPRGFDRGPIGFERFDVRKLRGQRAAIAISDEHATHERSSRFGAEHYMKP